MVGQDPVVAQLEPFQTRESFGKLRISETRKMVVVGSLCSFLKSKTARPTTSSRPSFKISSHFCPVACIAHSSIGLVDTKLVGIFFPYSSSDWVLFKCSAKRLAKSWTEIVLLNSKPKGRLKLGMNLGWPLPTCVRARKRNSGSD